MTKYVVFGYIGFNNFGDEAITQVVVDKLKSNTKNQITVISSNPSDTKQKYKVESCGMLEFFLPILKADILISGGGSLLQSVTSFKSLLYYLGVIWFALILGKKVELHAQGIGPIDSFAGKLLTKFTLKFVSKITVRDKKSQELLSNWKIQSNLVKDPIFEISIPEKEKNETVGIQLRNCRQIDDNFLNLLANSVTKYFGDKKIEIFSLQDSCDIDICNKFANILKEKQVKSQIHRFESVEKTIEDISALKYLIAMRFHANVIGIKAGARIICINYDPKVQKLAEEYNLPYINFENNNFTEQFKQIL